MFDLYFNKMFLLVTIHYIVYYTNYLPIKVTFYGISIIYYYHKLMIRLVLQYYEQGLPVLILESFKLL